LSSKRSLTLKVEKSVELEKCRSERASESGAQLAHSVVVAATAAARAAEVLAQSGVDNDEVHDEPQRRQEDGRAGDGDQMDDGIEVRGMRGPDHVVVRFAGDDNEVVLEAQAFPELHARALATQHAQRDRRQVVRRPGVYPF
jgi:hypothetical protein